MNKSDSEKIETVLCSLGLKKCQNTKEAHLLILNTCGIRLSAENRFLSLMKSQFALKNHHNLPIIGVTGCLSKALQKKIDRFADFSFDIKNLKDLPEKLQFHFPEIKKRLNSPSEYLETDSRRDSSTHAYIPIMSGCDNFCSYCIVPYARGREYSRPSEEILRELQSLLDQGYKAFTLLGQNVNSYGKNLDEDIDFPTLLQKICQLEGNFWLWFLSSHPKDMSDALIKTIAQEKKLCNYLHFAVQSGSDKILKSMNREHTMDHYLELVGKIKVAIPEVMLSTDIIVGFPNETPEDFEKSLELCQKVGFEMVYVGRFSRRPLTPVGKMKDNVSPEIKKERENKIMAVVKKENLKKNKSLENKEVEVLVDKQIAITKSKKTPFYLGKTETFKTVKFTSDKKLTDGSFVTVKITKGLEWGLEGEAL